MLQISEITIISIDKSEDSWAVEGEILFEEDLSIVFEVTYLTEDDELENLSMEPAIDKFDITELKEKIIQASIDFED